MDTQTPENQRRNPNGSSVKSSAKTVELAIEQGLQELGLTADDVQVNVINEGSRGIFGLGAEDAVVQLTPLTTLAEVETEAAPVAEVEEVPAETVEVEPPEAPETAETTETAPSIVESDRFSPEFQTYAIESLGEILAKLGLDAEVTARLGDDLVEEGERVPLTLDITGQDLGILIGRRGETLQSLQFVMRQILSKEAGRWVPVAVDVEAYLSRHRQSLKQLADRLAENVVAGQRKVVMEPMSSYDRRIVHMQLRDRDNIYTSSVGEGDRRKVVIYPK